MKCPLCSFEFDPAAGDACPSACPLHGACSFVCCPRCGYQIADADRAQSVQMIKRLLNRFAKARQAPDDA
ncbi:MAG: hypothetical protein HZB53_07255 [Chloroflexi bacterium]|nr:hypothetical protein [Chloroflexota bacterium]